MLLKTLTILLFLLLFSPLYSKIEITFGERLNFSAYPNLSLKIKVTKNGEPITVDENNVLILDDNIPVRPKKVDAPDFNKFQKVLWTASAIKTAIPTFYITFGDEVGIASPEVIQPPSSFPFSFAKFVDNDRNLIKELRFGNVPVGEYTNARTNVVAMSSTNRILVDGVGVSSESFKYLWLGSSINTDQPPTTIVSPFPYAIEVLFLPSENKYYREYLTVYYDGGRESHLALVGNSFPILRRTLLELIEPSGGEIFTPCQVVKIRWKGHRKDVPTIIEYTTDKGKNWTKIDEVTDSEYNWFVPNIDADEVLVRVRQDFVASGEKSLDSPNKKPQKVAFSSDGNKFIIAFQDGKLTEYDATTSKPIKSYTFTSLNFPLESSFVTGLSYFEVDTFAVISYRWMDYFGQTGNDSLVVINLLNGEVVSRIPIQTERKIEDILVDDANNKCLLAFRNENIVEIIHLPKLNLSAKVSFPSPIQKIAIKDDLLAVGLLSNEIKILNLKDFTEIKHLKIKFLPYFTSLAISNDKKFVAFTTKTTQNTDIYDNFSDAFVIEIESGQIVRSLYKNWSEALGIDFSPTDNYLVLGFENNPYLVLWDLVLDQKTSSIYGSSYSISDFKISPTDFTILTAEPERSEIIRRELSYPEMDIADSSFKIKRPLVRSKEISFPPQHIYHETQFSFTEYFCNIGQTPLIIEYAYLLYGKNFSLPRNYHYETLKPGECLPVMITYNPKDTGLIHDTLIFLSCGNTYFIPLRGYGLNRNLKILVNPIDFGEVCVNESKQLELEIAENLDSIDLPIDFIRIESNTFSNFKILFGNQPQVLAPKGRLKIILQFTPTTIGKYTASLDIYYLGQRRYIYSVPVLGIGFGTNINPTPNDLRFIPEIPQRQFTLTNTSETDIVVDSIVLVPSGYFAVDINFPFILRAKSSKIINISLLSKEIPESELRIHGSPCAVVNSMTLGPYIGKSKIILPIIQTEPKGLIKIPIEFSNSENKPYNGRRFFEAEFSVNPRIFIPFYAESDFGEAEIIRNEIVFDRRFIAVRVNGNFPPVGTAVSIVGNVALAETDSTFLKFTENGKFWGKNFEVEAQDGIIKLIGLCENRRIIQKNELIRNVKIFPNPVGDILRISLFSEKHTLIEIRINDVLGNHLLNSSFYTTEGEIETSLDVSNLPDGIFSLVLVAEGNSIVLNFVKFSR